MALLILYTFQSIIAGLQEFLPQVFVGESDRRNSPSFWPNGQTSFLTIGIKLPPAAAFGLFSARIVGL